MERFEGKLDTLGTSVTKLTTAVNGNGTKGLGERMDKAEGWEVQHEKDHLVFVEDTHAYRIEREQKEAEEAKKKATLIKEMADVLNAKMIPMYDYRPKYPKIDPEVEINPNHPNLTIWHNDIKAAIFVGVHCHYANVALKIVRSETDCYTIAICGLSGHEDAMATLRDQHTEELARFIEIAKEVKAELGK